MNCIIPDYLKGGARAGGFSSASSSGRSQTATSIATVAMTKSKPIDILLLLISPRFHRGASLF
jgi:hypothetical protein